MFVVLISKWITLLRDWYSVSDFRDKFRGYHVGALLSIGYDHLLISIVRNGFLQAIVHFTGMRHLSLCVFLRSAWWFVIYNLVNRTRRRPQSSSWEVSPQRFPSDAIWISCPSPWRHPPCTSPKRQRHIASLRMCIRQGTISPSSQCLSQVCSLPSTILSPNTTSFLCLMYLLYL